MKYRKTFSLFSLFFLASQLNGQVPVREPMIAELVSGNGLNFINANTKQTILTIAGKYFI